MQCASRPNHFYKILRKTYIRKKEMLLIKRKKIKKMLKNKLESLNLHREKMIWPRRTLNLLVQNKYEQY